MDEEFRKQMQTVAAHGLLSLSIALGVKLKLFDRLASKEQPKTAAEIAREGGLKERAQADICSYVQEWLNAMACGSIIEVDETGEKFWIKKELLADLQSDSLHSNVAFQQLLPIFGRIFDQIVDVFQADGPIGMDYGSYTEFYKVQNEVSTSMHKKHLLDSFLPLTGLQSLLSAPGIRALDVGCGAGFHVCHFAKHYPQLTITGVDITAPAVAAANKAAKELDLPNAIFLEMDGAHLSADWTNHFDWVAIFDACHDQQRPDLTLKEIHRVLKPNGVFTMLEVNGTSNAHEDRETIGLGAAHCYAISLFHCLPVGSNSQGSPNRLVVWRQLL